LGGKEGLCSLGTGHNSKKTGVREETTALQFRGGRLTRGGRRSFVESRADPTGISTEGSLSRGEKWELEFCGRVWVLGGECRELFVKGLRKGGEGEGDRRELSEVSFNG